MKRLLLSFFSLFLVVALANGQDAMKAYKAAKKAYSSYELNQDNKTENLAAACESIDVAVNDIEGLEDKDQYKIWALKGKIYTAMAANDNNMMKLDPEYLIKGNPAVSGYTAYRNAFQKAVKKWEKKDALSGVFESAINLADMGKYKFTVKDYAGAYESFNAMLESHEILVANGNKSTLQSDEDVNGMRYSAGISAYSAGMMDEARPIFEELAASNYEDASIYEVLYKAYLDSDEAKAVEMLEEGRKRYPDNVGLLFAEINHYLRNNKLDELTDKLKTAIEKEPDNISLYTTLGNVYDNLYQRESEAGNAEKSGEYFNLAMEYYSKALEKDDQSFDAIYSIGALHYNKAAAISKELIALDSDYSKEGMRKYKAKEAEVYAAFDKALPYFKKAEALNANDRNTLIALKEIFAKKDDIVTSNEFKKRLENLDAGVNNESYFKK